MLKLPEPEYNGYEVAAEVALSFLPYVRSIHIHGELRDGDEASSQQLEYYRTIAQIDFPETNELDDHAFAYYEEIADMIDVRDFGLHDVSRANIQAHYRIELVTVPPLKGTVERFLVLSGECDWDPEHGIEFIVKNSHVVAVGASEGVYQGAGWDDFLNSNAM